MTDPKMYNCIYACVSDILFLLRNPFVSDRSARTEAADQFYLQYREILVFSTDPLVDDAAGAIEGAIVANVNAGRGLRTEAQRELIQILSSWLRLGITRDQLKVILFDTYLKHSHVEDEPVVEMVGELQDSLDRGLIEQYAADPKSAHEANPWLNPSWDARQR